MSDFEVGIKCCWEQHTFKVGETARKCGTCQKVMTISAWEEKRRCRCGSTNTILSVARSNSVSSATTRISITQPVAPPTIRTTNQPNRPSRYSTPPSSTDRSRIRFNNSPSTIPEFNIKPWHYFVLGVILTFVFGGLCWFISRPTTSPTSNTSAPIPSASVSSASSASPSPSITSSPAVDSISKEDAVSLVKRWLNARSQMFAPPYNQEVGKDLAIGKAYSDKVHGPSSDGTDTSTLEWLKKFDYYYTYNSFEIGEIRGLQKSGNDIILDLVIIDDKIQYDNKRRIVSRNSGKSTSVIRYRLRHDSDKWKIADIEELQKVKN
jgi:ARC6-like, IMS domain